MASRACGFSCSRSSGCSSEERARSTCSLGMVSVPVLSITSASILRMLSRAVASLMSMFFLAALPIPTIRAVGVASPSAQGQAMTSTLTADRMARGSMYSPPRPHQSKNVSTDRTTTVGTKMSAILSTTRCTGAFEPWASCTVRMMPASSVSLPTACALKRSVPCFTIVPANTFSPAFRMAGTGSPVIMLSSMETWSN